ncbi:uncharacterized protein IUM83_12214 [Phytophthora cinnamomi]|uniref:uncharacterized protein n=1 Tax=Phytophthora cinnamomi TaxID=4785 RepID=UPI00355A8FCB|nr:hypothetical protein IUM83_12214 [Phytophthora cinnamomi]
MLSACDASVFTAVHVVTREAFAVHGVATLPHVAKRIDAFLDTLSGPWAVEIACWRGDSKRKLSYLAAHDPKTFWRPAAMWAAMQGHIHVLQWLHDHHPDRCEWSVGVMDDAARCRQLTAVRWLHANRSEGCTSTAMTLAAAGGDLEMVKWLHHNRREGCTTRAMDLAAKSGYLDVVQWLHNNRSEGCTTDAMDHAAANGHLHVVRWLSSNRHESHTGRALEAATRNGHLAVTRWLDGSRGERPDDRMLHQDAVDVVPRHGNVVE